MKLSRLGEFGLIERFRRQLPQRGGVRLGIGDDAAWVENRSGSSLVTADMLIEGVHFNLNWTSLVDLGFKSLAVNLSDIAAMGGIPAYAVVSLGLPADFEIKAVDQLYRGLLEIASLHRVSIVGGDLSSAKLLTISVALIGHPPRRPILRSGAGKEDDIYVTGTLGDSALALKLLRRGSSQLRKKSAAHLFARHHRPTPRTDFGKLLGKRNLATAMIDVSDGLLQDLSHICRASRIGAMINRDNLPLSEAYRELTGKDGDRHALAGGEDYELLFCARSSNRQKIQQSAQEARLAITRIGRCVRSQEILLRDRQGRTDTFEEAGYDHFCSIS